MLEGTVSYKDHAKSEGVGALSRTTGVLSRILRKKQRNIRGLRKAAAPKMSNGATNSTAFSSCNAATPYMANETSRTLTFRCGESWQHGRIAATPEQMAKAGFFYMGETDRVKCWYCNGALEFWDYNDDPWIEHAKWYPSCEFTLHRKGAEFASDVMAQFPDLTRPDPSKVRAATSYVAATSRSSASSRTYISRTQQDIIDPREDQIRTDALIQSTMEASDFVNQAIEMGFAQKNIRKAVRKHFQVKNRNIGCLDELLDTLNEIEGESLEVSCSQNSHPISNSSQSQHEVENGAQDHGEHSDLANDRKCKICFDLAADIVFVPCGHLSTCEHCAQRVTTCSICRSYVREKIKTYIS